MNKYDKIPVLSQSEYKMDHFINYDLVEKNKGNQGGAGRRRYIDLIVAFDIETTNVAEIEQSFMYIWQVSINAEVLIIGRTWNEFLLFVSRICDHLKDNEYVIFFVHNLSFEFQFLRGIYDFDESEVMCIDSRKILKCEMLKHIEFRCSYLHSNMNLKEFCKKMQAKHGKLTGDLDYSIYRDKDTVLTDQELAYCYNDVLGLCEAIQYEMKQDHDTLHTLPLTSTGYVRRDIKEVMWPMAHSIIQPILYDIEVYRLLRLAFRGGNTHANRYFSKYIVENVSSADRSSSYPDVQINCKYPMSKFVKENDLSINRLEELLYKRKRAALMYVTFCDLELKNEYWGAPYLSKHKCFNRVGDAEDNGRVLCADYLETCLTDVDYEIVKSEYKWSRMEIRVLYHARYGYLPDAYRDVIREYYIAKTALKGDEAQAYLYMKSKNKLNAIYGMSAQNPVKPRILFKDNEYVIDGEKTEEELLETANRKAYTSYAWGVWCTAWARYRLEEGIRLAGDNFVYCDTDSVKYIGDIDWTDYNKARIKDSTENKAYAVDIKGITHYMGVYEPEHSIDRFCTMGAKKYACEFDGKLEITVAGVNKKAGAVELGSIENFKEDFVFRAAGGKTIKYNDKTYGYYKNQLITANAYICDSTYTLSISDDYREILSNLKSFDFAYNLMKRFKNDVDSINKHC